MPRVLIAGYYGHGNAGDEAMLAAIVRALRSLEPGLGITVLSSRPEATAADHGVQVAPRLDIPAMLRAIRTADLVLIGGGSLLQDVTSRRSMVYYLGIAQVARCLGKRVMLFANGIGPVRTTSGRLLMRLFANGIDLITVRDRPSLEELSRLGVTRPRIELSADPALLLPLPAAGTGEAVLRAEGLWPEEQSPGEPSVEGGGGPQPLLGLSVRTWKGSEQAGVAVARAADRFCRLHQTQAVLVPMQHPSDVAASEQVAAAMETSPLLVRGYHSAAELMGLVSAMDLMVGVRFHALVFAALAGVPLVGLSYDPKIDNFLGSLGLTPVAALGQVTEEDLF
ncbi:MAG: polysaccharide pyruvyl transferase CsaB, partial [Firmicutes bacterium]|nr:polysaccharide pyruvyl transferase CsaB [Bacillota bacterium]